MTSQTRYLSASRPINYDLVVGWVIISQYWLLYVFFFGTLFWAQGLRLRVGGVTLKTGKARCYHLGSAPPAQHVTICKQSQSIGRYLDVSRLLPSDVQCRSVSSNCNQTVTAAAPKRRCAWVRCLLGEVPFFFWNTFVSHARPSPSAGKWLRRMYCWISIPYSHYPKHAQSQIDFERTAKILVPKPMKWLFWVVCIDVCLEMISLFCSSHSRIVCATLMLTHGLEYLWAMHDPDHMRKRGEQLP